MIKSRKKYTLMGGVKVSSQQLARWGSSGGRPKKYANAAERKRAYRLKKKQAQFGSQAHLEPRKTYGEAKIKRFITCPNCSKLNHDLKQYFNEKGEYVPETYWFDTAKWEKTNIRENLYHCTSCSHAFSFLQGEIKVSENKAFISRAGTVAERKQGSQAPKTKK